jgi:phosphoglycerate-specific signal transduction histidine kinase
LQQRVFQALDSSITVLASTIDAQIELGEAQPDDDFTLNGTIAYRYNYLMYRLSELMKLDQKIRQELAQGEQALAADITPVSVVQQYQAVSSEYDNRMTSFVGSLSGVKQAVQVHQLREELDSLQHSVDGVKKTSTIFQNLPSKHYQEASVHF